MAQHMRKPIEDGGHGGWPCRNNCGERFKRKSNLRRHQMKCKACEHCDVFVTNVTNFIPWFLGWNQRMESVTWPSTW